MDRPVRVCPTPQSQQDGTDSIGNSMNHKGTRKMQLHIKWRYLARVEVKNWSKMMEQFGPLIYVPE